MLNVKFEKILSKEFFKIIIYQCLFVLKLNLQRMRNAEYLRKSCACSKRRVELFQSVNILTIVCLQIFSSLNDYLKDEFVDVR